MFGENEIGSENPIRRKDPFSICVFNSEEQEKGKWKRASRAIHWIVAWELRHSQVSPWYDNRS